MYAGHVFSAEGVSPEENRVHAINSLKSPENLKELRSFLGMINYCAKFIPQFATITQPLRNLLKQTVKWKWDSKCETSFKTLKNLLSSSETLAYYNPRAFTELVVDASPFGLGAVIYQKQTDGSMQPISYASRALSPVEQRYSQIERECLAIHFGILRFKIYLYGLSFTVKTDHKHLLGMFKSTNELPPRIE